MRSGESPWRRLAWLRSGASKERQRPNADTPSPHHFPADVRHCALRSSDSAQKAKSKSQKALPSDAIVRACAACVSRVPLASLDASSDGGPLRCCVGMPFLHVLATSPSCSRARSADRAPFRAALENLLVAFVRRAAAARRAHHAAKRCNS